LNPALSPGDFAGAPTLDGFAVRDPFDRHGRVGTYLREKCRCERCRKIASRYYGSRRARAVAPMSLRRARSLYRVANPPTGKNPRGVWAAGPCAICGKPFIAQEPRRRYCSSQCAQQASNRVSIRHRTLSRAVRRAEVFVRDAWVCLICGLPTVKARAVPHPLAPTVDHVVPLCRGGSSEMTNLQTAHFRCNVMKAASVA
jgi:5-methylcytosine-specific restriction endonuclease McrA